MKITVLLTSFLAVLPLIGVSQTIPATGGHMPRYPYEHHVEAVTATANARIVAPMIVRKYTDLSSSGTLSKYFSSSSQGDFVLVTGSTGNIGSMRSVVTNVITKPAIFSINTESNFTVAISVSNQAVVTSGDGSKQVVQIGDLQDVLPLHSGTTRIPATGQELKFAVGAQIPSDFYQTVSTGQLSGAFNVTICNN